MPVIIQEYLLIIILIIYFIIYHNLALQLKKKVFLDYECKVMGSKNKNPLSF